MSVKIRVLVVDDEEIARRRLVRFLKTEPDVEVVGTCGDGRQAIEAITRTRPNVMFLDVQMPEMSGFDLLSRLEGYDPIRVVFVTAYHEYAVRAFEVGALDYLLKPFGAERFSQAFARVRADLRRGPGDYAIRLAAYIETVSGRPEALEGLGRTHHFMGLDRLMIKDANRVFFVKVAEIHWIEAADNYVRIHAGKDVHLLRQTLSTLEDSLDRRQFARIHRRALVNLDRVREIHRGVGRDRHVVLEDGTTLRLSDRYRERLETVTQPGRIVGAPRRGAP
jgi:two-component system LytT family response regulator